MSKSIFSLALSAVLVVAAAQAVSADDAIATSDLAAMGLAGLDTMTDSDALAVRGKGWMPPTYNYPVHPGFGAPGADAYGTSWANISNDHGSAGTDDGFFAVGHFSAGGSHFSEAGKEIVTMEIVEIDGSIKKHTTTEAVRVFAGGMAESMRL